MIIKERRSAIRDRYNRKYEYFGHYLITLNDYDSELEDNLCSLINDLFQCFNRGATITPKGIDVMIHSDNMLEISANSIMDILNEYDDYSYLINIETLSCPNLYKDANFYWVESDELIDLYELNEMWSNSFVGYGDYDDDYPTTIDAFISECTDEGLLRNVEWITE